MGEARAAVKAGICTVPTLGFIAALFVTPDNVSRIVGLTCAGVLLAAVVFAMFYSLFTYNDD